MNESQIEAYCEKYCHNYMNPETGECGSCPNIGNCPIAQGENR